MAILQISQTEIQNYVSKKKYLLKKQIENSGIFRDSNQFMYRN